MGDVDEVVVTRPERRRQRRSREFLDAAQHIVTIEGFEALTMSRLARELDTVDSAVYRYFPSKGALIAEIQKESVERLEASLTAITASGEARYRDLGLDDRSAAVARLVLFGRWFCATSETYFEELRLLQMIMSQRATALDPDGGARIFPIAMQLLGHAVAALEVARVAGALHDGDSIDRAVVWASALSGVLETDDLERYASDLFGGARLAREANLTLLAGWGAEPELLAAGTAVVDGLATSGPLAP